MCNEWKKIMLKFFFFYFLCLFILLDLLISSILRSLTCWLWIIYFYFKISDLLVLIIYFYFNLLIMIIRVLVCFERGSLDRISLDLFTWSKVSVSVKFGIWSNAFFVTWSKVLLMKFYMFLLDWIIFMFSLDQKFK
jgi:hypothetical protein